MEGIQSDLHPSTHYAVDIPQEEMGERRHSMTIPYRNQLGSGLVLGGRKPEEVLGCCLRSVLVDGRMAGFDGDLERNC